MSDVTGVMALWARGQAGQRARLGIKTGASLLLTQRNPWGAEGGGEVKVKGRSDVTSLRPKHAAPYFCRSANALYFNLSLIGALPD